jgi:predicted RNA binding protein YcfA (HicA-like mRNA interferase family)
MGGIRLPRVSGRHTVRALSRADFTLAHVRGSHHYLRGVDGRIVPVPIHAGRTLPLGTLRSILRLAGLSVQDFIDLLDE